MSKALGITWKILVSFHFLFQDGASCRPYSGYWRVSTSASEEDKAAGPPKEEGAFQDIKQGCASIHIAHDDSRFTGPFPISTLSSTGIRREIDLPVFSHHLPDNSDSKPGTWHSQQRSLPLFFHCMQRPSDASTQAGPFLGAASLLGASALLLCDTPRPPPPRPRSSVTLSAAYGRDRLSV